jgi:hypothetical protein
VTTFVLKLVGGNCKFPDPTAEANELADVDAVGREAYLLLADRSHPPLSAADAFGATVRICRQNGSTLIPLCEATALDLVSGATPPSVVHIYGALEGRSFRRLTRFRPIASHGLTLQEETKLTLSSAYALRSS